MIIDPNFQTPLFVCQYMRSLIPEDVVTILEPTPGLRQLSGLLVSEGFQVTEPEDYFLHDQNNRYDCIVGNPPFSGKSADLTNAPPDLNVKGMAVGYHILSGCMEMSENLVMLMPWFTISDSDVRMRKIKEFGLISVTPLPRKTFDYARIQTVVLQMKKGYTGETKFNTDFFFPKTNQKLTKNKKDMRCLNCNQKFIPKVFLQKFCEEEECKSAKLEYQANKMSGAKKPQKPIKKVSEKRTAENLQYVVNRIVFLGKPENQKCFIEGCSRTATTIEHTAGRKGFYDDWARDNNISLFLDQRFWKPCCGPHNRELENNPEMAKKYQLSKIHGGKKL